jgi:hypothetical protein
MATECANCGDCDAFPATLVDPLTGGWLHPDGCPLSAQLARLGALGDAALALDAADIDEVASAPASAGAGDASGDRRRARGSKDKRKNMQDLYETDE